MKLEKLEVSTHIYASQKAGGMHANACAVSHRLKGGSLVEGIGNQCR